MFIFIYRRYIMAQFLTNRQKALLEAVKHGTFRGVKKVFRSADVKKDKKWFDYILLTEALKRGHETITNFLLDENCRVKRNDKIDPDCTPLYYAVKLGDMDIINKILRRGASSKDSHYNESSPLYLAIEEKKFNIADIILSQYNFEKVDVSCIKHDIIHFHVACATNNLEIMKKFVNRGVSVNSCSKWNIEKWRNFTGLHFAIEYGYDEYGNNDEDDCEKDYYVDEDDSQLLFSIHFLLHHGADLYARDARGLTPFHLVFVKYDTLSHNVIPQNDAKKGVPNPFCIQKTLDIIEVFLKNESYVNDSTFVSDKYPGSTPLHYAADYECTKVIKLLLISGVDLNVGDNKNRTALHCAVYNKSNSVVDFLLEHVSKDINLTDLRGLTHFHIACMRGNPSQVETFLRNGASPNSHVDLDDVYYSGYSALHFAIDYSRLDIVKLLLKYGAYVNVKTGRDTLLQLACQKAAKTPHSTCEIEIDIVEFLLEKGADANYKDETGKTALHIAVECAKVRLVEVLLKYNADVNARNTKGYTSLDIATSRGSSLVAKQLLRYGADINSESLFRNCSFCCWKLLRLHVCKLLALKFHVRKEVIHISPYRYLDSFDSSYTMVQCTKELGRLKQMRINIYCSLHDILTKDHIEMAKYVRNNTLETIVWGDNFQLDFPLYHDMLRLQYMKGINMSPILERAKMLVNSIVGLNLPDSCSELILGYLTNEDIKNLMEANKTDSHKRKLDVSSTAECNELLAKNNTPLNE